MDFEGFIDGDEETLTATEASNVKCEAGNVAGDYTWCWGLLVTLFIVLVSKHVPPLLCGNCRPNDLTFH